MREFMFLVESHGQLFLHGSPIQLPPGTILEPRGDGLLDGDIEEFLEKHRPADKPAREQSVYMVKDAKQLDNLALRTEHVYQVEPQGPVAAFDHAWVVALWRVFAEADSAGGFTRGLQKVAGRYADGYWSGAPSNFGRTDPPQWEYLTASARIIKET